MTSFNADEMGEPTENKSFDLHAIQREPRKQQTYRSAVFTLNNPTQDEYNHICQAEYSYCIIGLEVAPTTGTQHLQGFIELKKIVRWKKLKEILGNRTWFEGRRGTAQQAADYCKKGGHFTEDGEISKTGHATALISLQEQLRSGMTASQIMMDEPHQFHLYGRTLNAMEDNLLRQRYRTVAPLAYWLWGVTGSGKSHEAFYGFTPDTHYVVPDDGGWWDNYMQQETVIFNDFRGSELNYNQLLQMLDVWPWQVRRRGRQPMPFTSTRVYFTSSLSPSDLYQGNVEHQDNIAQLLRRLTEVRQFINRFDPTVSGSTGNIRTVLPDDIDSKEPLRGKAAVSTVFSLMEETRKTMEAERLENIINQEVIKNNAHRDMQQRLYEYTRQAEEDEKKKP